MRARYFTLNASLPNGWHEKFSARSFGDVDRTRARAQEFGQRHRNSESAQLFKNQLVTDKKIQQRAGADCHEVGNQIVEVKADCQQFHQHDVPEDGNQPI